MLLAIFIANQAKNKLDRKMVGNSKTVDIKDPYKMIRGLKPSFSPHDTTNKLCHLLNITTFLDPP